ncbi:alpha-ketoglutarate-dependent dioxygenase AlkB family protein [Prochlorococcus sp. MIT 1341]|uniref:alpha-ketoglutarate-dependent dioxygenase AlkB family protein n=1 Tax=Prochlorococcus sp. MIT 1341 TaxID=3096221 RepID=UPI0039BF80CA
MTVQNHLKCYPFELRRSWFSADESIYMRSAILKGIQWTQPTIRLFGKKHLVPRMTCFMGHPGISYSYSGVTHNSSGWQDWMIPLLERLNETCNVKFNGCLFNLYRNGNDSMGWHSDNESELDPNVPIASLSLGGSRDFSVKHRYKDVKSTFLLTDGDLLIMQPSFQVHWLHSLPKRRNLNDLRINITFRCFLTK